MALGPVARCDEFTDDIYAFTQLNKNGHRLHLCRKFWCTELMMPATANKANEMLIVSEHLNENFNNQR